MTRHFEKPQGDATAFWEIEQQGVRYRVAWGTSKSRGVGQTCTRESEEDCRRMVERKIREKLKEGFVEVASPPPKPAPPLVRVLDAYLRHAARFPSFKPHKVEGLQRSHHVFGGLGFEEYVVVGPTETVGLWFTVKAASHDPKRVRGFLRQLEARHAEVFAVEVVWKLRLDEPIGAMTHAVVLGPEVARLSQDGLAAKQLFHAFPVHDCEFRGDESVAFADARIEGRNTIPMSTWDRAPHPVLDMRIQSAATKKRAKLMVFAPDQVGPVVRKVAGLPAGSFVEVCNYRGELCRVTRGAGLEVTMPGSAPAATLSAEKAIARLNAFIHDAT
jgi:predicted DNA-binding WGR domain protein